MSQVRVAVIPAPGAPIEMREVGEPDLEAGAALLLVELSEVCGTDVSLHSGKLEGVPYPLVPGHVSVGRLEKIRGSLADVDGRVLREGDRVSRVEVSFNPHADLNRKHLDVRGCWGSDFSHFYRAVRIAADPVRSAPWARIPVRRYALGETARALDDVAKLRTVKALIDPRVSA